MSFLNPFKRRRGGEEVELQCAPAAVAEEFAPATPPVSTAGVGAVVAAGSAPAALTETPEQKARVHQKAAYFESLINGRSSQRSSSASCADSDSDSEVSEFWEPLTCSRRRRTKKKESAPSAAEVESLRHELERMQLAQHSAEAALQRKSQEAANLLRVVKELTDSRAAALAARADLAERYCDLQRQHSRMMRVAHLSHEVSRENIGFTLEAREAARGAERLAHAARGDAAMLDAAQRRAAEENARLREKVSLLERLDMEEEVGSVCMRSFTHARVVETY